ncbi:MAG: NAD-dependent epimerase/dehydratase family protein [Pseudomonadota bacterium]|nr:NAD-dependent epimerase/dehydratase family protein [Pseudomonadota bacterium]
MPTQSSTLPSALIVFGGTGFVGTAVLAQALSQDPHCHLFVVSRTGVAPAWVRSNPTYQTQRLHFLQGDLLAPHTVIEALQPVSQRYRILACISCVGAITPWSNQNMVRTCGDANIHAYTISKSIGAEKFVVMTRDRSNMDDWWYPFPRLIPGYYEGKSKIETCIQGDADNLGNAVCLRAGFVSGTRRTVPGLPSWLKISVPLQPMYKVLQQVCPVIDVEVLASAAVRFALSPQKAPRVLVTNDEIPTYFDGATPA